MLAVVVHGRRRRDAALNHDAAAGHIERDAGSPGGGREGHVLGLPETAERMEGGDLLLLG